jgi:cytoskeletal protein RodZ
MVGRVRKAEIVPKRRRSMKRRFAILFAVALVSVSGAAACGGVQDELQKRAQEEVEKRRQQVEQKAQEERRKVEKNVQEKVQEGRQRVEEEVKKAQKQVEKGQ